MRHAKPWLALAAALAVVALGGPARAQDGPSDGPINLPPLKTPVILSPVQAPTTPIALPLPFPIPLGPIATVTPVATGLSGAIGQAYRAADNSIFFTEYVAGRLSRLNLATNAVTTVHTGFVNPEGVALYPNAPLAYVTTRDGKLWKASTGSSTHTLVAGGLGMPHQLVLDPSAFAAYIADYGGGHLWKVNLGTGATTAVVSGLSHPIGLLMSANFKTAYVSEADRILSIDLATTTQTVLVSGLTNAFFMDWADDSRDAIYYVERDPANRVSRLDLTTSPATRRIIATVPWRPSSVVRSLDADVIYVASDSVISKIVLSGGSGGSGGPVITRLGHIPSTTIDWTTGLATTSPAYFFYVKNASFGGSVQMMLNFPGMRASGAAYYKVMVDGESPSSPEIAAWTNYEWNGSTFVLQPVAPSGGFYKVPSAGELWAIPDLGFVIDTTKQTNGRHVYRVKLYNAIMLPLAVPEAQVAIDVDNTPPTAHINGIEHDGAPLDECALITSGSSALQFDFTAFDPQGHLHSYALTDTWGHGHSAPVASDQYIGVHDSSPTWFGVDPLTVVYSLGCTQCAHQFRLEAWGNTTNGYDYIHYSTDFVNVAVYLAGGSCS